jgi:hypothetical protein
MKVVSVLCRVSTLQAEKGLPLQTGFLGYAFPREGVSDISFNGEASIDLDLELGYSKVEGIERERKRQEDSLAEEGNVWLKVTVSIGYLLSYGLKTLQPSDGNFPIGAYHDVSMYTSQTLSVDQFPGKTGVKIPVSDWLGFLKTWQKGVRAIILTDRETIKKFEDLKGKLRQDDEEIMTELLDTYPKK